MSHDSSATGTMQCKGPARFLGTSAAARVSRKASGRVQTALAEFLVLPEDARSQDRIWSQWSPDPLPINLKNGVVAGNLAGFSYSLSLANPTVLMQAFSFRSTSNNWTNQGGHAYVQTFDANSKVIATWDLGYLDVQCGNPPNKPESFSQTISPDLFEVIQSVSFYLGDATYFECHH